MATSFSEADLASFFDVTPGVGQVAQIFKPDANGNVEMDQSVPPQPVFLREFNVLFFSDTQEINMYTDTNVVASNPSIVMRQVDADQIPRAGRCRVKFLNLVPTDDGYGQTFEITKRNVGETVQSLRLHLKQL